MLPERLKPILHGPLLIGLAAALWGTTGIAAKLLFTSSDLPPLTLAFLRLLIAAPVFLAFWRASDRHCPGRWRISPWLLVLGLAQAAYQASYLGAVDLAGAGLATLVALCLAPVFVAIAAVSVLGERLNWLVIAGLFGAIVGTGMLVLGGGTLHQESGRLAGLGVATVAAVVYAGFTLISRHTASDRGPYEVAAVCFSTGALTLLPAVLWQDGLAGLADLTPVQVALVLYVGLVPTCLGYICFFSGMRHTSATASSIIVTLEPLFAALLAWLILDEYLGAWGMLGAVLLVIAVAAASKGAR